ncbi:helix-turn-helix transcriptional regulator [Streptomyces sp. CAU 1734]|uniref:helix-turn-helix domain-containing protein n=1 Tax=Streptomyces sp. CAU 1734 TaxID=3140360 RepID=UPI003260D5E9
MSHPTVRRRRLGYELRRLREAAGLKLEDVQSRTTLNVAKVSRIETARFGVKAADLEILLDLYDVDDPGKRTLLHTLAKDGARRGWWQTYRDIISPEYAELISLEADASGMRTYQTTLIPGLLQTSAYARATIGAINITSTRETVNALVEVRMARQAVLTRPNPLEMWAIIHESALRTRLPDKHAMREQLQKLLDLAELSHVSIQVLPLDSPPHPGLAGPFAAISFPEAGPDLDVVLLEQSTSALYVEDAPEVAIYGTVFDLLRAAALPFDASADLIATTKDKLK